MKNVLICTILSLVTILSPAFAEPAEKPLSGDLVIFHAGSLSVPFTQISQAFNKVHPNVRILREAAGSRACARKLTDLDRTCDVFASADYTVIDTLLIPQHTDWNLKFAGNEMTIVYSELSRHANKINTKNWHEILMLGDVAFGRSDPNADPCGYRAVLTMKLAEKHYGISGLAARMQSKDKRNIRPKETDLLALLETGTIDYIFLYRSVAQQHGLKYILLPNEINLKVPAQADFYKTATVNISGKTPGSFVTKMGEPMIYGITIPSKAKNPAAAQAFVNFLLTKEKGMAIMKQNGQSSLVPSPTNTFDKIPTALKKFAKPKKVKTAAT